MSDNKMPDEIWAHEAGKIFGKNRYIAFKKPLDNKTTKYIRADKIEALIDTYKEKVWGKE